MSQLSHRPFRKLHAHPAVVGPKRCSTPLGIARYRWGFRRFGVRDVERVTGT